MQTRSNIGVSLKRKRKKSFIKKACAYFIFILFFISLAILGLTNKHVRIKNIIIDGNTSVKSFDVLKIANDELYKNYLWIIPTDNILLLRSGEIENQILNNIKKAKDVSVSVSGIDEIKISIKERVDDSLWCKDNILNIDNCYSMDSEGFIFEKISDVSQNIKPIYSGLIKDENPIGQFYFKDNFNKISSLYKGFQDISFSPQYFEAINENEYKVGILGGGYILLNNKKSFESSLTNLQALVANKYIGSDEDSIKKIKYVDLRFGNKVNFELN